MKIKFSQSIAGVNWSAKPGDVSSVDDEEALNYCAAGIAEPVEDVDIEKVDKFIKGRETTRLKKVAAEKKEAEKIEKAQLKAEENAQAPAGEK